MKGSIRLGRILGIEVFMHLTFLLLLAWVGLSRYLPNRDIFAAVSGVLFIVILFGIVVLHELGHAMAARRFGIRTRDITLLPIGGLARLERMPEDPKQELVVAIAGPAVNVALAVIVSLFIVVVEGAELRGPATLFGGSLARELLWINVALAGFNMIPAFPMDGGRVLRALLAMRMDYVRATRIAAWVGQALAFVFGFVGLFTNPFLVFIALFVWMGAAGEANLVQMKSSLSGLPVSRAMITDFRTIDARDGLRRAVEHILAGFQHDFPVVEEGRVVGVLTREDLLKAIAREGMEHPVADVMRREFQTADPGELLEPALARLRNCECRALPVVRDGRVVGILTLDNVGELLMVQAAMRDARRVRPA